MEVGSIYTNSVLTPQCIQTIPFWIAFFEVTANKCLPLEFVKDNFLCQPTEKQVATSSDSPLAVPNNDVSNIRFLSFSLFMTTAEV